MVGRVWGKKLTGIQEVMSSVVNEYRQILMEDSFASTYLLEKRNLTPETIEFWQIGYAPGFNYYPGYLPNLGTRFNESEYDLPMLAEQGLLVPKKQYLNGDGSLKDNFNPKDYMCYRDFFINRITFPVRDQLGKVVGFVGRDLNPDGQIKYLNSKEYTLVSSEPTLFKKGKVLFGYYQAREHIKESKQVVITEGQLDLIHAWQHGIRDIVATTGTAFTDDQAKLLKRHSNLEEVILAFDGDEAGVNATKKAAGILFRAGLGIPSVYDLPDGMDLDDFVTQHGDDSSSELNKHKVSFIDFYLDHTPGIIDDPNILAQAVEDLVGYVDVNHTTAVSQMFWLQQIVHKMSESIVNRGGQLEITPEIILAQYNHEFSQQLKRRRREQGTPKLDHSHQIYLKAKRKLIGSLEFSYNEFPEKLQGAIWKYFSYLLTADNKVARHYLDRLPSIDICFNDEQRGICPFLINSIRQTNEPLARQYSETKDMLSGITGRDALDYVHHLESEEQIEYVPVGLEEAIINPLDNGIEGVVSAIEIVIKSEQLGSLLYQLGKANETGEADLVEKLSDEYVQLLGEIGIEGLEQF
jgi:DNA primase catalytic core